MLSTLAGCIGRFARRRSATASQFGSGRKGSCSDHQCIAFRAGTQASSQAARPPACAAQEGANAVSPVGGGPPKPKRRDRCGDGPPKPHFLVLECSLHGAFRRVRQIWPTTSPRCPPPRPPRPPPGQRSRCIAPPAIRTPKLSRSRSIARRCAQSCCVTALYDPALSLSPRFRPRPPSRLLRFRAVNAVLIFFLLVAAAVAFARCVHEGQPLGKGGRSRATVVCGGAARRPRGNQGSAVSAWAGSVCQRPLACFARPGSSMVHAWPVVTWQASLRREVEQERRRAM